MFSRFDHFQTHLIVILKLNFGVNLDGAQVPHFTSGLKQYKNLLFVFTHTLEFLRLMTHRVLVLTRQAYLILHYNQEID